MFPTHVEIGMSLDTGLQHPVQNFSGWGVLISNFVGMMNANKVVLNFKTSNTQKFLCVLVLVASPRKTP